MRKGRSIFAYIFFICIRCKFGLTHPPTRAGRSPEFQDPGTPLNGLAGTCQSHEADPFIWTRTRESHVDSRVPEYPIPALPPTPQFAQMREENTSPYNLHSQHFSTHPRTPICILCKLEKPYAKMDHPKVKLLIVP